MLSTRKNHDYNFSNNRFDILMRIVCNFFYTPCFNTTLNINSTSRLLTSQDISQYLVLNESLRVVDQFRHYLYDKLSSPNITDIDYIIERFMKKLMSLAIICPNARIFDPPYELHVQKFTENHAVVYYDGKNHSRPVYNLATKVAVKLPSRSFTIGSERSDKPGKFDRPWGVCCDKYGNVYVTERHNHRVQIFGPDGKFRSTFGSPGEHEGEFNRPAGLVVDNLGRIIVVDKDNHRVQIFNGDGRFLLAFGSSGTKAGEFNYPWDVAVNEERIIAVADSRNHRIQGFTENGRFLWMIGVWDNLPDSPFDNPRGVCFAPSGHLLVTDFNRHSLVKVDPGTRRCHSFHHFKGQSDDVVELNRPQGVICDDYGNVIISDSKRNRILVVDEQMQNYLFAVYDLGYKNRPQGIGLTPTGRIIMTDEIGARVTIY